MLKIMNVYLITWSTRRNSTTQCIQFPMILKDIPKFERLNNVAISVYAYQTAGGQEGFIYL